MNAKEYLSQAYRVEKRIDNKFEQVRSLNELATKCTSVITGVPSNSSNTTSKMADTVLKIIDLQNEINDDIDKLINLKCNIVRIIKLVNNIEFQNLLEQRYLCYCNWEQIACEMGYSLQHTFRLHSLALNEITKILKDESKCD